jgi:hypothetical protein
MVHTQKYTVGDFEVKQDRQVRLKSKRVEDILL